MMEKLDNLLFHPSTLINYRYTKLYKVIFVLLLISIFSIIVPLIDTVKSPGITISDKDDISEVFAFDFSIAKTLPDCQIENSQFSCDESGNQQVFGKALRFFTLVTDENDDMDLTSSGYYIKFTKDNLKIVDKNMTYYAISYHKLPDEWHNIDFKEIKNSNNPEDELYLTFLGGFNKIAKLLLPLDITIQIIVAFIFKIIEILFFSSLFYLIYKRLNFKFKEIFKITVFAQIFAVTIGVIFELLNWGYFSSFLVTTLTFIYVYKALYSNVSLDKEF